MGFKKTFVMAAACALGLALNAKADTITLHDASFNATTGVYKFTVEFDGATDIKTGDGFTIYDFGGATGASFSDFSGSFTSTVGSGFNFSQQATGNNLNSSATVDILIGAASGSVDDPGVNNLVFKYTGADVLGAGSATLTINTTLLGGFTQGYYGSVDHSGNTAHTTFSYSVNPVTVPAAAAPLPAAATTGLALLSSIAGVGILRRRRAVIA